MRLESKWLGSYRYVSSPEYLKWMGTEMVDNGALTMARNVRIHLVLPVMKRRKSKSGPHPPNRGKHNK